MGTLLHSIIRYNHTLDTTPYILRITHRIERYINRWKLYCSNALDFDQEMGEEEEILSEERQGAGVR